MILCNRFILTQQYNVLASPSGQKNRVSLNSTHSLTEVEITLFSMKQEELEPILQKEKLNEPITVKYDGKKYKIIDYWTTIHLDSSYNISSIVIHGYVNQDKQPEFEIID